MELCFLNKDDRNNSYSVRFLEKNPSNLKNYHYFIALDNIISHLREYLAVDGLEDFAQSLFIYNPKFISSRKNEKKERFLEMCEELNKI